MASSSTHVAAYQMTRYGPNESVPTKNAANSALSTDLVPLPGDFILTHSSGMYGKLVRFGEAIRYWGKDKIYAHWSHAAIFVDEAGDIVEALSGGVQKRNISVYRETEYVVVHLPPQTIAPDRTEAVAFAEHCLNDKYGWLTIVSITLCLLTGGKVGFGVDGQQICSALVARSLERIGEIFREGEPWHLMPANLAKHFDIRLTGDKGEAPTTDDGVVRFSRVGKRQR